MSRVQTRLKGVTKQLPVGIYTVVIDDVTVNKKTGALDIVVRLAEEDTFQGGHNID